MSSPNVPAICHVFQTGLRAASRDWNKTGVYDPVGNLTNVDYPFATMDVRLKYDELNRLSNMVDAINELTCETADGVLTAAGTTTALATNVTVFGAGLTNASAQIYDDASWARDGVAMVTNGSLSATASDSYGRTASTSIPLGFPSLTACFTYDDNGNLLSDGLRYFEYDYENQLTAVTLPNSWRSEFSYDGFGRRRIRREYTWQSGVWTNLTEVRYVYDGRLVIQEQDTNSLPIVYYTRGNDLSGTPQGAGGIGGMLARSDAVNALGRSQQLTNIAILDNPAYIPPLPWFPRTLYNHHFYHADGNGNITALFSPRSKGGAALTRYSYDPFGNVLWMNGPMATTNLYRFSSKEFHERSGLIYYLYRYYEPNLQRWINRDPLGDLGNLPVAINGMPSADSDSGQESTDTGTLLFWAEMNCNLYTGIANRPIVALDYFGLAPGDPYPTCDAAGIQAIKDINAESIKKDREFGGNIYQKPDGTFSYTAPDKTGKKHSANIPVAVPEGTTRAGMYHTHGADNWGYDDEKYSDEDKALSDGLKVPSYLGTPKGDIKKYTPDPTKKGKGEEKKIGSCK